MELDPCRKVLEMEEMLAEILQRVGCSKSFVSSGLANKEWLRIVQTKAVINQFALRNKLSFLGFVAEYHGSLGQEIKLIFPAKRPINLGYEVTEAARSMRARFKAAHRADAELVGCHGGLLISKVDGGYGRRCGFHTTCPYSKPTESTFVAERMPWIRINHEHDTPNTYGQYGLLPRSGDPVRAAMGVIDQEAAAFFDSLDLGVRFNSRAAAYVHVCIYENDGWTRYPSPAICPQPKITFHRKPYCVVSGEYLYMMYVVDRIICFNIDERKFSELELPACLQSRIKCWFDYTVTKASGGRIALIHFNDTGSLDKWVMDRGESGTTSWSLELSIDLPKVIMDMISHCGVPEALVLGPINWGSVQVRSASPGGRYVLFTFGHNEGLFVADMDERKLRETPHIVQSGVLGRIFPLCENWPPAP